MPALRRSRTDGGDEGAARSRANKNARRGVPALSGCLPLLEDGTMARVIDPDHHLWKNGRLYWTAFTVHLPGWRKHRVRRSLGTSDREEARSRRDALLAGWGQAGSGQLSLRFVLRQTGARQ